MVSMHRYHQWHHFGSATFPNDENNTFNNVSVMYVPMPKTLMGNQSTGRPDSRAPGAAVFQRFGRPTGRLTCSISVLLLVLMHCCHIVGMLLVYY